jgi:RNA polymerase sigma factor (sigma-70 family)
VASGPFTTSSFYLSALFRSGTLAGLSDGELLERFASRRGEDDETAELAFATLVARHGAMVLRVCHAVLGDRHEAEDAFQATFLVLAMRAGSIRRVASVGSWLHGVTLRVAARARSRSIRRQLHERRRAEMAINETPIDTHAPTLDDDSDRVLHEEIGRLPERFRSALVLCYLEGLTHEMAADQLGCPVGTIRSRLATARERLRRRLNQRGLAPAVLPVGLPGSVLIPALESAPMSSSVPVALADATVRGALRIGLGKGALAGIVSVEAINLMEEVLKTMMTTKIALVTTTVILAGIVTTTAGVTAYSALGGTGVLVGEPDLAQPAPQKADARKPATRVIGPTPAMIEQMRRQSEENIRNLMREYESENAARQKTMVGAKTAEERKALRLQQSRRPNPASYAGALLYEAEANPGTPGAEEALIWIVTHLFNGSIAEHAKEIIARDHIQSEKIEPLLTQTSLSQSFGSGATEKLFAAAMAKNPKREIRGIACFSLARFLDNRASFIRTNKLFAQVAPELETQRAAIAIEKAGWGQDFVERLDRLDPGAVEREAAIYYERVVKEFGDLPLPHPFPNPTGDLLLPGRPTTYGGAAQAYLHELRELGIGRPAPEIEGVDLDGKPMKLSDYRGRVVALYFCMSTQLRADGTGRPASVTEFVREVAESHATDPFVLLGVTTPGPGRTSDREFFTTALKASRLPARFWWDIDPDGKPGPIQTAWNARMGLYVLDHRGTIRYKNVFRPEIFEKAVATLLQEQKDEVAKGKKAE